MKIIAMPGNGSETIELVFNEPLSEAVEHNLEVGLKAGNFSVSKRCPDGKTFIWECRLRAGDVVTETTVKKVEDIHKAAYS